MNDANHSLPQLSNLVWQRFATRYLDEFTGPLFDITPIDLAALAPNHAGRVLEIARPPGKQLVQKQILGGRERNRNAANRNTHGALDCLSFIESARENHVDTNAPTSSR